MIQCPFLPSMTQRNAVPGVRKYRVLFRYRNNVLPFVFTLQCRNIFAELQTEWSVYWTKKEASIPASLSSRFILEKWSSSVQFTKMTLSKIWVTKLDWFIKCKYTRVKVCLCRLYTMYVIQAYVREKKILSDISATVSLQISITQNIFQIVSSPMGSPLVLLILNFKLFEQSRQQKTEYIWALTSNINRSNPRYAIHNY